MPIEDGDSTITVVRTVVLEFLEEMKKSKRLVEQEIRDQTDNVLTQFFNKGMVQYTRSDIQNFNKKHREAFLSYYNNIIYLRIISNASKQIKKAIEEGFNNPKIIQEEWLEGINDVQKQLVHMNELAETVKAYKNKIDEQSQIITELSSSSSMSSNDLELYQKALEERDQLLIQRDQIIIQKDNEIQNLTQGLQHMEGQSNNLGQTLLEYNMNIEELQETINSKDEEIEKLIQELKDFSSSNNDIINLKNQLQEAENTIRKLEQEVSTASADLVTELQDTLEKTRAQVLELRREIVQKNDKIHNMAMEKEEILIESKNSKEQSAANLEKLKIIDGENSKLRDTSSSLRKSLTENTSKVEELSSELIKVRAELKLSQEKLSLFEGKESISAEEKEKISSKIVTLESKMKDNQESLEYLSKIIGSDIKFRTLFFLQSVSGEIRADDLAQGVGIPMNVVHRVLIELNKNGQVSTRKDGRYIYAELSNKETPFKLTVN